MNLEAPPRVPAANTVSSPQQRLWRVLRFWHAPRALGEIYTAANIEPELFLSLISNWADRGFLVQSDGLKFHLADRVRDRKFAPPALPATKKSTVPKYSGRQRLWAAMRVLKEFDLRTICLAAEAGEKGAIDFLNCLGRVGYVASTPSTPDRPIVYRLVRNTGPRHPVVRRRNEGAVSVVEVDDRNDGTRHRDEIDFSSRLAGKSARENGGVS